ncbi:MAG: biotin/lipoyl-containing protein [Dongiaceae bacterium]
MSAFALPDLGEGLQEAEVVAWHVSAGDHVVPDQPLVSVETEKAVVEVPSPRAGRIARLCAAVGERVPVGGALVEFEDAPMPTPARWSARCAGRRRADPGRRCCPGPPGRLRPCPAGGPAARRPSRPRPGADRRGPDPRRRDGPPTSRRRHAGPPPPILRRPPSRSRGVRRAMAQAMARSGAEVVPATVADDADVDAWAAPEADVTVRADPGDGRKVPPRRRSMPGMTAPR